MHGSNIKIVKNMRKKTLEAYKSCFMQGTARKNSLYLTKKAIVKSGKNGHYTKAIAFEKRVSEEKLIQIVLTFKTCTLAKTRKKYKSMRTC